VDDVWVRSGGRRQRFAGSAATLSFLETAGEMTGLFYHEYPPATSVLRSNTFGRIIGTNLGKEISNR
jgi:hypothetical protein